MKRALVCSISGQNGAYQAKVLLGKGFAMTGTSRDAGTNPFHGLARPSDPQRVCGDPSEMDRDIGWSARCNYGAVVKRLIATEMRDSSQLTAISIR